MLAWNLLVRMACAQEVLLLPPNVLAQAAGWDNQIVGRRCRVIGERQGDTDTTPDRWRCLWGARQLVR